jgi:predicted N-acetyltransferase YhbS
LALSALIALFQMDPHLGTQIDFRRMAVEDVPGADVLRQFEGWNQTIEDWRRLLSLQPDGCFVATSKSEVVGSVTTTTYGSTLGWIGMMLVHPDYRNRGIGTRLMRLALDYLDACAIACVKLDATPAGQPVYEKLGFIMEETLTRFMRPANDANQTTLGKFASARRLNNADWPSVELIDTAAFGASRDTLLRGLERQSRATLVWTENGCVTGYGMLRSGSHADYLGPLVSSDNRIGVALASALLASGGKRPVIWDVPDRCTTAKEVAQRSGFMPRRILTRMRRGSGMISSNLDAQFAIADPALG